MTTYIYGLCDPRTDEVMYVGRTYWVKNRISEHLASAKRGVKSPVCCWIRSIFSSGLSPKIIIIDSTDCDNYDELEKQWIRYYEDKGGNLTNYQFNYDKWRGNRKYPFLSTGEECVIKYKLSPDDAEQIRIRGHEMYMDKRSLLLKIVDDVILRDGVSGGSIMIGPLKSYNLTVGKNVFERFSDLAQSLGLSAGELLSRGVMGKLSDTELGSNGHSGDAMSKAQDSKEMVIA